MSKLNQGIQGSNITINAQSIAVGPQAQAVSMARAADPELVAALQELQQAIGRLNLPPAAHEAVKKEVVQLAAAARDPAASPDRWEGLLKGVAAKLAAAGVILKETTGLADGLTKIAGIVKVSLGALGL
jgi:hypothetical protein